MVDEFQDTDPVQWQVIDRAFSGHSTLILIGDPKQAIYAFRGGDIATYLHAADDRRAPQTLGTNWRSDAVLVESLQAVLRGAELGAPDIVVREVTAHHQGHRLAGAPHNAPFRLRVVVARLGARQRQDHLDRPTAPTHLRGPGRRYRRPAGQRRHLRRTAAGGRRHRGHRREAQDARACHDALAAAGIPAVYTGDSDVFSSEAAEDWLCLLEAFDQPHRSGLVRAAATTMFFGETAEELAAGVIR